MSLRQQEAALVVRTARVVGIWGLVRPNSLLQSSKRGREIDCLKHELNPELEAAKNFTERLVCPLTCG